MGCELSAEDRDEKDPTHPFLDIPKMLLEGRPAIQTHRLRLRPLTEMDVDDAFAIISNPTANRLYGGPGDKTEWVETMTRLYEHKGFPLAVTLKTDGRLIGEMYVAELDWVDYSCVVGYLLDPAYWNHGYATEALKKFIEFLVEEMEVKIIYAQISVQNSASKRVYEMVGFKEEGYYSKNYLVDGEYGDSWTMVFDSSYRLISNQKL